MTRKKTVWLSVVVIIIGVVLSGYFIVWRPSDDDIQNTLVSINEAQKLLTDALPKSLDSASRPSSISIGDTKQFVAVAGEYVDAVSKIDTSSTMNRSVFMNGTYKKNAEAFQKLNRELLALSKSLQQYGDLLLACDPVAQKVNSIKTKAEFNTLSSACEKAAINTSSPSKAFNEAFYDNYRTKVQVVLDSTKEYFGAIESIDIQQIRSKLDKLNMANSALRESLKVRINLQITLLDTSVFDEIKSDVKSYQSSIIR